MAMTVAYTPTARRDLIRLDRAAAARVRDAVAAHAARPDPDTGPIDALARGVGYRLAVGGYRVLFNVERGGGHGMVVQCIVRAPEPSHDG